MAPEVVAVAPSNIALIKYWGRDQEEQKWPSNDSLSMTLSAAQTRSHAALIAAPDHQLTLNDRTFSRDQDQKIFRFLDFMKMELKLDAGACLKVETKNSFPTGCGLASSASGFSALALAAAQAALGPSAAKNLLGHAAGLQQLAYWARMGSGSATRSVFGGFVHWQRGAAPTAQTVQPLYGADHWPLCDTVVLFSEQAKPISSSQAHKLASTSPLFPARIAGLSERFALMLAAIKQKDLWSLGPLLEAECLEMHAIMMSSQPPVCYFDQRVGEFLGWLRRLRQKDKIPAFFTMDAGPNVHILCEPQDRDALIGALRRKLPDVRLFLDQIGEGLKMEEVALNE